MDTMREKARKRLSFILSSFFLVVLVFLSACGGGASGGGSSSGGGGTSSTYVTYSGSNYAFNYPIGVAVDGNGNVWVTNQSGKSITQIPFQNASSPQIIQDADGPMGIAIDGKGNVWITNADDTLTEINPSSLIAATSQYIPNNTSSYTGSYDITIDGNNNVWVVGNTILTEVLGGNMSSTKVYCSGNYGGGCSNSNSNSSLGLVWPKNITADGNGNLWIAEGDSFYITKVPISNPLSPENYCNLGSSGCSVYENFSFNYPLSISIDKFGNIWILNSSNSNNVVEIPSNNPSSPIIYCNLGISGCSFTGPFNFNGANEIETDGAGNVWVANGSSIVEMPQSDPTNPRTFNLPAAVGNFAIDENGNIWVTGGSSNNLYEFKGVAAPTPIPLCKIAGCS